HSYVSTEVACPRCISANAPYAHHGSHSDYTKSSRAEDSSPDSISANAPYTGAIRDIAVTENAVPCRIVVVTCTCRFIPSIDPVPLRRIGDALYSVPSAYSAGRSTNSHYSNSVRASARNADEPQTGNANPQC